MNFRSTSPADHPKIARLLTRVFQLPAGNLFESEPHQTWKYWQPRSGWEGSRSFVLEKDDQFLAHGCVWPLPIATAERNWNGIYLIDWAADPAAVGVGIALLRKVAALGDAVCAIGGSEMTRAILPKIGFRPYNEMWFAARPLRPLRQALTHQNRNWKLPARWARNTVWRYQPPTSPPAGWTSTACLPRDIPAEVWPRPAAEFGVGRRDAALFEYLMSSPWASFVFRGIARNGSVIGYFCLGLAGGQARVVDLWMPSRSGGEWAAAYLLAMQEARRHPEAAEITAAASLAWGQEGLLGAGFHVVEKLPVTFFSSGTFPGAARTFHLQMLDADFGFLHLGEIEYRT